MKAIRTLRETAGLAQKDLAELLNVTRQTVWAWETGQAWPSSELLPELCDILECSLDDLYAGDEPGRPDEGIRPYAEEAPETGDDMTDKEDLTC